jgi:glycine dehydrogenase subunit 1
MAYLPHTSEEIQLMLGKIGAGTLDELFETIPAAFRASEPLRVPTALSELELTRHMTELSARNVNAEQRPCFLGGGAYDRFIPAVVDQLAGRGEFYTAYTPYQAEASQGTLQAIFEYQTLISQLTGMDLSNASLYDGGSAVAEAVLMAVGHTERTGTVVMSRAVHPEYRQVVRTYLANLAPEMREVEHRDGRTDPTDLERSINDETAAVVIQQPNFFGQLEPVEELVAAAHRKGALAIVSVDPVSLGLLKRPGHYDADIVTAEGQPLGNPLVYGGPYLGILACREEYVRRLPGRLVGQTTDRRGKRCWVLTLQTREQHIKREKATSNICTNQGLFALRTSIYLAALGPEGLRRVAVHTTRNSHMAAERLSAIPGLELAFSGPFFQEFVIRAPGRDGAALLSAVDRQGFHGGIALGRWYPQLADAILIAVTEKRTDTEIEGLARAYEIALASSS